MQSDMKRHKQILKASLGAERCQRNWDYTPIPQQDIDTIIQVCTNMPTKQNIESYKLIVSINQKFNNSFFKIAIDPKKDFFVEHRNSQTNAPMLMMWSFNSISDVRKKMGKTKGMGEKDLKNIFQQTMLEIGISAGAAALGANYLGYKSGFCRCFDDKQAEKLLKEFTGKDIAKPQLTLGVGLPGPYHRQVIDKGVGFHPRMIVKENNSENARFGKSYFDKAPSYDKSIPVEIIK